MAQLKNRADEIVKELRRLAARDQELRREWGSLQGRCPHDWRVVKQLSVGPQRYKRYRCAICRKTEDRPLDG